MEENGFVKSEISNGVGRVIFYHPKGNSLPGNLLKDLRTAIIDLSGNEDVKVILLESEGKTFCAGASFDELLTLKTEEDSKNFFLGFARVINAMRKSPKLIISKVQGKTVGGGVGIVAASDYAIASTEAQVRLSELSIGIAPFVIGPAVVRKIGISGFAEMSIDTEWKSADWALQKGLFNKIADGNSELASEVNALTKKLIKYSPEAMKKFKEILWEGTEDWDLVLTERAEMSGDLALSEFTKKFLENFRKGKSK
jgi:methylglutaconyl-CoA hydratase